ncbi:MAG: hypothetical protein ABI901_08830 [Roseiflexaceae bacterium]
MILILSAGLTHGQLQTPPLRAETISAAALRDNTDAFRAEVALIKRAAPVATAQLAPHEEPPAPALLVYIALILVGGASAVALARQRLHRES